MKELDAIEVLRRLKGPACVIIGPDRSGRWSCELPTGSDHEGQAIGFKRGEGRDPVEAILKAYAEPDPECEDS